MRHATITSLIYKLLIPRHLQIQRPCWQPSLRLVLFCFPCNSCTTTSPPVHPCHCFISPSLRHATTPSLRCSLVRPVHHSGCCPPPSSSPYCLSLYCSARRLIPIARAASSRLLVTCVSVWRMSSFSTSASGVPGRTIKVVAFRSYSRRKSGS